MNEQDNIQFDEKNLCCKQKKGRIIVRKASGIIRGLILVLLLFFTVFILFFLMKGHGSFSTILNHQLYIVRSNSMSPALKAGSLVIVKLTEGNDIRKNDIITYQRTGNTLVVTHRVVEVVQGEELQFITKGDANNTNDSLPVSADDLLGRVTFIVPLVGHILAFAGTKQGALVLLIIPGILILLYQIYRLLGHFYKRHNVCN
jgi:signal peptidase